MAYDSFHSCRQFGFADHTYSSDVQIHTAASGTRQQRVLIPDGCYGAAVYALQLEFGVGENLSFLTHPRLPAFLPACFEVRVDGQMPRAVVGYLLNVCSMSAVGEGLRDSFPFAQP